MKRNRNSLFYKINHWINTRGWEEFGRLIFEVSTAIALFSALFLLPHFFH